MQRRTDMVDTILAIREQSRWTFPLYGTFERMNVTVKYYKNMGRLALKEVCLMKAPEPHMLIQIQNVILGSSTIIHVQ